ncbi:hypothetical protein OPT61_g1477 [Boeremia exigua]|uniref:Uncharacterized protein n=1 Tax=Boeremia exigua TaxID=749465 RepID=A0ACC2IQA3_9PLEO|nr:hypothetical protein OPT61_g1477 [Boeremia exigua]
MDHTFGKSRLFGSRGPSPAALSRSFDITSASGSELPVSTTACQPALDWEAASRPPACNARRQMSSTTLAEPQIPIAPTIIFRMRSRPRRLRVRRPCIRTEEIQRSRPSSASSPSPSFSTLRLLGIRYNRYCCVLRKISTLQSRQSGSHPPDQHTMQFLTILSASAALLGTAFAAPAKGGTVKGGNAKGGNAKAPASGPASASVTIYPSYTCTESNTRPPTDGTAGTGKTVSVTEGQCVITNIPLNGAVSASLTATPKAGALGCYLQLYKDQGCGVTLSNQYHGYPFNGVAADDFVGCAAPVIQSYGALAIQLLPRKPSESEKKCLKTRSIELEMSDIILLSLLSNKRTSSACLHKIEGVCSISCNSKDQAAVGEWYGSVCGVPTLSANPSPSASPDKTQASAPTPTQSTSTDHTSVEFEGMKDNQGGSESWGQKHWKSIVEGVLIPFAIVFLVAAIAALYAWYTRIRFRRRHRTMTDEERELHEERLYQERLREQGLIPLQTVDNSFRCRLGLKRNEANAQDPISNRRTRRRNLSISTTTPLIPDLTYNEDEAWNPQRPASARTVASSIAQRSVSSPLTPYPHIAPPLPIHSYNMRSPVMEKTAPKGRSAPHLSLITPVVRRGHLEYSLMYYKEEIMEREERLERHSTLGSLLAPLISESPSHQSELSHIPYDIRPLRTIHSRSLDLRHLALSTQSTTHDKSREGGPELRFYIDECSYLDIFISISSHLVRFMATVSSRYRLIRRPGPKENQFLISYNVVPNAQSVLRASAASNEAIFAARASSGQVCSLNRRQQCLMHIALGEKDERVSEIASHSRLSFASQAEPSFSNSFSTHPFSTSTASKRCFQIPSLPLINTRNSDFLHTIMPAEISPITPKAQCADIGAMSSAAPLQTEAATTEASSSPTMQTVFERDTRANNSESARAYPLNCLLIYDSSGSSVFVAPDGSIVRSSAGFKAGTVPGNYRSPFDHNMVHRTCVNAKTASAQQHTGPAVVPRGPHGQVQAQAARAHMPTRVPAPSYNPVLVPTAVRQTRAVVPPPGTPQRLVLLGPLRMIRSQCVANPQLLGPILVWLDQFMGAELHTPVSTDDVLFNVVYAVNIPMDDEHWRDWNKVLAVFPRAAAWHDMLTHEEPFDQVTSDHPTACLFIKGQPLELERKLYTSSPLSRLPNLLVGDYNMTSAAKNFVDSDLGIFMMLMLTFFAGAFLVRTVARQTVLPRVYRFLIRRQREQQQQHQEELERHQRVLDHILHDAIAERIRAAVAQQLQDQQDWRDWMEELERRANTTTEELQFRPVPGSLLYDSDDEYPEVIRGDKKGKRDK